MANLENLRDRLRNLETLFQRSERSKISTGLPLPTTFDGTTDFQTYLKHFNCIATAHNWTPERCCQILPIYLRGSAKAIYDSFDDATKGTWRNLVDTLAEKVKRISSRMTARQLLSQRRQQPGESLEEFAQAIRELVTRAYPENSLAIDFDAFNLEAAAKAEVEQEHGNKLLKFRNEICRDFFRSNMLPQIKEKCLFMDEPETLEDALSQAKRVEQTQGTLTEELWKEVQGTKAEVALAEVNAIRAELTEMRGKRKDNDVNRSSEIRQNPNQGSWQPDRNQGQWNTFNQRGFTSSRGRPPYRWQGNRGNSNFGYSNRGNFNSGPSDRGRYNNWQNRGNSNFGRQSFGNNTFTRLPNTRGNSNFTPLGNRFQQPGNHGEPPANNNFQNFSRGRGQESGRGRGNWRVNEVTLPFICMATLLLMLASPISAQYQICPSSPTVGSAITISFPAEQNCTLQPESPPRIVEANLFVPIRLPQRFPIFKCWNITTIICTEAVLKVFADVHDPIEITRKANIDNCWDAYKSEALIRTSETTWETPAHVEPKYGWYGVECQGTPKTVIEEGLGGILEGKKLVTSWGDSLNIQRNQNTGWIRFPGAIELLFWKIPSEEFWDTHFKFGPVKAEIWDKRAIVVDELQYTFVIADEKGKDPTYGVPSNAIKAQNNVYVDIIRDLPAVNSSIRIRRDANSTKERKENTKRERILRPNTRRSDLPTIPPTIQIATTTMMAKTEILPTSPSTKILTTATPTAKISTTEVYTTEAPTTTTARTTTTPIILTTTTKPILTTTTYKPITRPITKTQFIRTTVKPIPSTTPRPRASITTLPIQISPSTTSTIIPNLKETIDELKSIGISNDSETEDIAGEMGSKIQPPTEFTKISGEVDEYPTTVVSKREIPEDHIRNDDEHTKSRLNYLGWKNQQTDARAARERWISSCHEKNNALSIAKGLAKQMPEEAARTLYKRDDITAFWTRSTPEDPKWTISLCQQVKIDSVHWEQKIGDICYLELPVTVARKTLFVKPGTRDLVTDGTRVNCDAGGKNPWATSHNNSEELNADHRFRTAPMINLQNPLLFTVGTIFESELERLEQNLQDLTKRVNQTELEIPEIVIIEANQTDVFKDAVQGITNVGQILVDSMQENGKILREKAENVIEKGQEWLEDPIGIIKYLKWGAGIVIGTIALIILIILLWKFNGFVAILKIPIQIFQTVGGLIIDCIWSARDAANRNRTTNVNAIELNEFPQSSAPTMEELLDHRVYVLNYVPKVCQIGSSGKKKRCYISIAIDRYNLKALFDTGADITYMKKSTAKQCRLDIKKGDYPQARAANATSIRFIGSVFVPIKIGTFEEVVPILVSEDDDCPCTIIVGTDLMDRINEQQDDDDEIGLNFKKGIVRIGHTFLPMVAAIEAGPKSIEVRLMHTHSLPPLSDSLVWGSINRNFGPDELLITSEKAHNYFPLRVGKCLVQPGSTRIVPLRLLNFGNCELKVHANSRLAILDKVDDDQMINAVNEKDDSNMVMNDAEWAEFKAKSNHISPEADWTDETLEFPTDKEKIPPILDRISLDGTILSQNGIEQLKQIIQNNESAFVKPGEVGTFRGKTVHRIDLIDGARPVQQRPYNYPVALQPEIERQVKELLKQNVIRPSTSAWASPIVLVKKPDNTFRFCVDYRKVNQLTKRSTYYLPRIQSLLDEVTGKKFFSVVDCSSGFFHIRLEEGHQERSAFICHMGLFEWLRCPFGLAGAPTTFQKAMEEVRQMCSATFLVYLDDCILGSLTEDEHLFDLDTFLRTMSEVGLRLKPEKCRFAQGEIRYLGHLISERGIRIDPKDLEPIRRLKKPTNLTELRSLIGLLSYFRKFIFGFADILQPIYELTKKESTTDWGQIQEDALEELKQRLMTAPVLAPPRFGKPFIVETDASLKAIAGCLMQNSSRPQDCEAHPISYFSRLLNKHEKQYSIVELEALAICASLKNFRPYLEGAGKSTVITDNSALTSLFRRKDLEGRLSRYQLAIMSFDIEIIYRPGKKNKLCDHLSRYLKEDEVTVNAVRTQKKLSREEMLQAQLNDAEIQKIREEIENSENSDKMGKWVLWNQLVCVIDKGEWKIYVPKSLRKRIFDEYHGCAFQGGHLGEKRTREKIQRTLYWEKMDADVANFVKACDACQRRKIIGAHQSAEPICPIEPASRPCERLHLDLMGPLQTSTGGFRYILMIVDSFSKYMTAIPLRDQTAISVTNAFVDNFLCIFGLPKLVVTDCGTQFLSETFESLAKHWGFEHRTTVPYHQSANGQCERYNRTLADMLSTTTNGKNWAASLPMMCFAYNSSINSQIGNSPFYILHAFDAKLPSEAALMARKEVNFTDMAIYTQEITLRMQDARGKVRNNLQKCAETMKKQQKRINEIPWMEGMLVLIRVEKLQKFSPNYEGPFRIIEIEKPNLVLQKLDPDTRLFRTHMDKCKPYITLDQDELDQINGQKHSKFADPNIEESDDDDNNFEMVPGNSGTTPPLDDEIQLCAVHFNSWENELDIIEIIWDGENMNARNGFEAHFENNLCPEHFRSCDDKLNTNQTIFEEHGVQLQKFFTKIAGKHDFVPTIFYASNEISEIIIGCEGVLDLNDANVSYHNGKFFDRSTKEQIIPEFWSSIKKRNSFQPMGTLTVSTSQPLVKKSDSKTILGTKMKGMWKVSPQLPSSQPQSFCPSSHLSFDRARYHSSQSQFTNQANFQDKMSKKSSNISSPSPPPYEDISDEGENDEIIILSNSSNPSKSTTNNNTSKTITTNNTNPATSTSTSTLPSRYDPSIMIQLLTRIEQLENKQQQQDQQQIHNIKLRYEDKKEIMSSADEQLQELMQEEKEEETKESAEEYGPKPPAESDVEVKEAEDEKSKEADEAEETKVEAEKADEAKKEEEEKMKVAAEETSWIQKTGCKKLLTKREIRHEKKRLEGELKMMGKCSKTVHKKAVELAEAVPREPLTKEEEDAMIKEEEDWMNRKKKEGLIDQNHFYGACHVIDAEKIQYDTLRNHRPDEQERKEEKKAKMVAADRKRERERRAEEQRRQIDEKKEQKEEGNLKTRKSFHERLMEQTEANGAEAIS